MKFKELEKTIKALTLPDGSKIVLLDMLAAAKITPIEDVNRNVFKLDQKGQIIWQISTPVGIYERTPYTNVYLDSTGKLKAYCWDGMEYEIDIDTGEVQAVQFLK